VVLVDDEHVRTLALSLCSFSPLPQAGLRSCSSFRSIGLTISRARLDLLYGIKFIAGTVFFSYVDSFCPGIRRYPNEDSRPSPYPHDPGPVTITERRIPLGAPSLPLAFFSPNYALRSSSDSVSSEFHFNAMPSTPPPPFFGLFTYSAPGPLLALFVFSPKGDDPRGQSRTYFSSPFFFFRP